LSRAWVTPHGQQGEREELRERDKLREGREGQWRARGGLGNRRPGVLVEQRGSCEWIRSIERGVGQSQWGVSFSLISMSCKIS